jgi:hypothetical protein
VAARLVLARPFHWRRARRYIAEPVIDKRAATGIFQRKPAAREAAALYLIPSFPGFPPKMAKTILFSTHADIYCIY